jgi:hypothetical protein
MSRITRYQESISKHMKNKSCITTLDEIFKTNIYKLTEESDYMVSIILLTVLSSQNRKNKTNLHGYYMGCGIELMMLMCKMMDNKKYYENMFTEEKTKKMTLKISTLINLCLSQNVEYIQTTVSKEKTLKIFHNSLKVLTDKLYDILDDDVVECGDYIKKTDILKYNFVEITKPKDKIMKLKQVNKEHLMKFINRKYCSVCKSAITIGWMLGCGQESYINQLEKMGEYLGIMMKISYDFMNLERDLQTSINYSYNYIINFGLQEAFELFLDNKIKLIENCMILDLYTHTMKEVLDVVEARVDNLLGKTKIDLRSNYTLTNSNTSSLKDKEKKSN